MTTAIYPPHCAASDVGEASSPTRLDGSKARNCSRLPAASRKAQTEHAKAVRAAKKECRDLARELTQEQYRLYDAIWWTRIRISSALLEHGRDTIKDINALMPNLLTHDPLACPADLVAERFGFESTSDLVEYLLAYKPRGPVFERFYEQLLAERGLDLPDAAPAQKQNIMARANETEVDTIPF